MVSSLKVQLIFYNKSNLTTLRFSPIFITDKRNYLKIKKSNTSAIYGVMYNSIKVKYSIHCSFKSWLLVQFIHNIIFSTRKDLFRWLNWSCAGITLLNALNTRKIQIHDKLAFKWGIAVRRSRGAKFLPMVVLFLKQYSYFYHQNKKRAKISYTFVIWKCKC